MTMYLIEGKMNSGKTLVSTFYALKDYKEGRKIISNYNINIPHYEINRDFLSYLSEKQPDTQGLSFFFDELWIWIDARNSIADKLLTYFFLQSSKGDTRIYMTAQKGRQIDVRVRENSHVLIDCQRMILLNNKMRKTKALIRDLGIKYYPYIYIKVREYENNLRGLINYAHPFNTYYLKADWLFKYYNTNQKIKKEN